MTTLPFHEQWEAKIFLGCVFPVNSISAFQEATWLRSLWEGTVRIVKQIPYRKTPKQNPNLSALTSVKGLKPEHLSWVVESTGRRSKGILSSIRDHVEKAFMFKRTPPQLLNIKLTHVSGTRPRIANFGGSRDTIFCFLA